MSATPYYDIPKHVFKCLMPHIYENVCSGVTPGFLPLHQKNGSSNNGHLLSVDYILKTMLSTSIISFIYHNNSL